LTSLKIYPLEMTTEEVLMLMLFCIQKYRKKLFFEIIRVFWFASNGKFQNLKKLILLMV